MNWYKQAKIKEYFNIAYDYSMDIKTAAIWSNLWRGIVKMFEGLGNFLFGSVQAIVSPIMTVRNLPLYTLIPFTPILDNEEELPKDPDTRKHLHCKGAMGIVCAIANLFRAVHNEAEAIVHFGLAAGETVYFITKKIKNLVSEEKINDTIDDAVDKYISEEPKEVDEGELKEAAEKTKKMTSNKLMEWIERIDYEMGTLMEQHVVSLK